MSGKNNPTELKSAEEWFKELRPDSGHGANLYRLSTMIIEKIQLNAYKAGMSEAASICERIGLEVGEGITQANCVSNHCFRAIETARDNKTSL